LKVGLPRSALSAIGAGRRDAVIAGMRVIRRTCVALAILMLLALGLVSESDLSERIAIVAFTSVAIATALGWLQLLGQRPSRNAFGSPSAQRSSARWWQCSISLVVVTGLAVQTWFRPNSSIARGDIPPPDGTAWIARLFEPWTWNGSNLGEPSHLAGLLPWAAVLGSVQALGGDPDLAQRIWYTVLFVAAGLGAFALVAALRMGPIAATIAAAVYLLNPYVVSGVSFNPVYLACLSLLAAMPAVVLAAGTGRLRVRWAAALLIVAATPILGYVYANPPLVGAILLATLASPLVAGWLDGRAAAVRSLNAILLALPLLVLASLYWILPALLSLSSVASAHLANLSSWTWTENRATVRNAFWLNTIWTWQIAEYAPYARWYEVFPLSLLRFVLPAVAFAALALGRADGSVRSDRALRLAVASATASIVIIFLSTGTNPPGSVAFDILYRLPLGWLLREPGRFLMAVALAYAVLVAIVVDALESRRWLVGFKGPLYESARVLRIGTAPLALTTALCLGFPLYTGAIVPEQGGVLPSAHVKMPRYWNDMARFVDRQSRQGAVLIMPPDDFYQMPYSWGYYGSDSFIVDLFHRPIVVPNEQGYSTTAPELQAAANLTARSILDHDWVELDALTTALNSPFILVRRDITTPFPGRAITSPNDVAAALNVAPGFRLLRTLGALELFVATNTMSESDVAPGFLTIDTQTPDLRVLSLLPPRTALVSGKPRPGTPYAVVAPPLDLWRNDGSNLIWETTALPGWTYRVADLESKSVLPPDRSGSYATARPGVRVLFDPNAAVTVSVPIRSMIANGDFSQGPWGLVGDCHAVLPAPGPLLAADVVGGAAPGGMAALRLSAYGDSACEKQTLDWRGGPFVLSLLVHPVLGAVPRLCLWESGADRCAAVPSMPEARGWSAIRAVVVPDPGTVAISLFVYADAAAPGGHTVAEYADVGVNEVPAVPSLALMADPHTKAPALQLAVVHNSFSALWRGSGNGEHVLVDGMLNGWLEPDGLTPLTATYSPAGLYRASEAVSLVVLLTILVLLSGICWVRLRIRRRDMA
jgi:hypothetical protein